VSAEIPRSGFSEKCAFVWELKAPQIILYERDDNKRRFRPTRDLIKAETQLLHYVAEHQDSSAFKEYYGLSPSSQIIPAGIIIGTNRRLLRLQTNGNTDFDEVAAARYSVFLRDNYMYRKSGIRVKTWDWVVRSLRSRAEAPKLDLSGWAG
jgi:hypothetical protein